MPSSPPALTHSLNSRGELGMFVNPYACSCQVCKDYLSGRTVVEEPATATRGTGADSKNRVEELTRLEELYEERWRAAGGGTLISPSHGANSTTHYLGAMLDEINDRRIALGFDTYSGPGNNSRAVPSQGCSAWGCTDKNCKSPPATPSLTSPPPAPRRFLSRVAPSLPPPPPSLVRVNAFTDSIGRVFLPLAELEENTLDSLATLRSRLQQHRARMPCDIDSEEAVAAADAESADIQAKIEAIEKILHAFHYTFRNP